MIFNFIIFCFFVILDTFAYIENQLIVDGLKIFIRLMCVYITFDVTFVNFSQGSVALSLFMINYPVVENEMESS